MMTRTTTAVALLSLVIFVLAMVSMAGSAQAQTVDVAATGDNTFDPQLITIEAGTTVRWVNEGGVHTVTANDTSDEDFDENLAVEGATFEHTFNDVGTFEYHCKPHASLGMVGTVVVTESSGSNGNGTGSGNGDGDDGDDEDAPAIGTAAVLLAVTGLIIAARRR